MTDGIDRPGLDYGSFDLAAADPALCRNACAADPKCMAWTYVKPDTIQGPRPRCWLKYGVPQPRSHSCCVSGVKAGTSSGDATSGTGPAAAPAGGAACYKDASVRDLDGYSHRAGDMTPQKCVALCRDRGFAYSGTQYGSQCYCGNRYGRYGPASNCDMRCSGDQNQICGGDWANSILASGVSSAPTDVGTTGGMPPAPATPSSAAWKDPGAASLIDEWLRQVERCTRAVHPGSYLDNWARICGQLRTVAADCSMTPDHPAGWTSQQYLWVNNFCHSYYSYRLQDYVRRRQSGASPESLEQCKPDNSGCF